MTKLLIAIAALSACATAPSRPDAAAVPTAQALHEQGLAAQRTGDSVRAEQYLAAALDGGYPADKGLPALLDVCLAADRYETALYYARRQLGRDPKNWRLRYFVATLHLATGQHERAIEEAERVVDEQPKFPDAYVLLGLLARDELRDVAAARRMFRRYLALAPAGPRADDVRRYLHKLEQPRMTLTRGGRS